MSWWQEERSSGGDAVPDSSLAGLLRGAARETKGSSGSSSTQPPAEPTTELATPGNAAAAAGGEAFVTYAQGRLKVFNVAKNFGFICPVFRPSDTEGPPLALGSGDGLWFFGNHSLSSSTKLTSVLSFEVWENSEGKPQARCVQVAPEQVVAQNSEPKGHARQEVRRLHTNEPRVIYPSVYISDVPVEYTEETLKELHKGLGLNPDTVMGVKFLPFTEVSCGNPNEVSNKPTPVTGAVIVRYCNEEAANAACERLRGHPVKTSGGVTKYLGARHAAPAKWMMDRKLQQDDGGKQVVKNQGEALQRKVQGTVARVSAAGYGVIRSEEWGEVMWRHYELPTNLRSLQFADPQRFQHEVQSREDYRRLKEMEGRQVEAELYRLPDGQLRASHVRALEGDRRFEQGPRSDRPRPSSTAGYLGPNGHHDVGGAGVVCVHPMPPQWGDVELRERFERYGDILEAFVVWRGSQKQRHGGGGLGVLRFKDAEVVQDVIRNENGSTLESGCGPVTVEIRAHPRALAAVSDFAEEEEDLTAGGWKGRRSGRDAGPASGPPGGGGGPMGMVPAGAMPWLPAAGMMMSAAAGMGMPGWGGASDQFYKTQPCPYHMQGACSFGAGCFFAHSMGELRKVSATTSRPSAAKKEKKEKKEKSQKEKKAGKDARHDDAWRHEEEGWRGDGAGEPRGADGEEGAPWGLNQHRSRSRSRSRGRSWQQERGEEPDEDENQRKRNVWLDDEDF